MVLKLDLSLILALVKKNLKLKNANHLIIHDLSIAEAKCINTIFCPRPCKNELIPSLPVTALKFVNICFDYVFY